MWRRFLNMWEDLIANGQALSNSFKEFNQKLRTQVLGDQDETPRPALEHTDPKNGRRKATVG